MISSFIVCLNRYRSAVVRDLESNDSLFVSQMYQDRSSVTAMLDQLG